MTKTTAYCYRSGEIDFAVGVPCPEGTLPLYTDRGQKSCRTKISATARHAYDGKTLLVLGVPEALDDEHALEAVQLHRAWLNGEVSDELTERRHAWQQHLCKAMKS